VDFLGTHMISLVLFIRKLGVTKVELLRYAECQNLRLTWFSFNGETWRRCREGETRNSAGIEGLWFRHMHDLLWWHDNELLWLDDGEGHGVIGRMKLVGVDLVRRRRLVDVDLVVVGNWKLKRGELGCC
jgi:hypothetical protein